MLKISPANSVGCLRRPDGDGSLDNLGGLSHHPQWVADGLTQTAPNCLPGIALRVWRLWRLSYGSLVDIRWPHNNKVFSLSNFKSKEIWFINYHASCKCFSLLLSILSFKPKLFGKLFKHSITVKPLLMNTSQYWTFPNNRHF